MFIYLKLTFIIFQVWFQFLVYNINSDQTPQINIKYKSEFYITAELIHVLQYD